MSTVVAFIHAIDFLVVSGLLFLARFPLETLLDFLFGSVSFGNLAGLAFCSVSGGNLAGFLFENFLWGLIYNLI